MRSNKIYLVFGQGYDSNIVPSKELGDAFFACDDYDTAYELRNKFEEKTVELSTKLRANKLTPKEVNEQWDKFINTELGDYDICECI